jgi:hypothetical protein
MIEDSQRWFRHRWADVQRLRDGPTLDTAGLPAGMTAAAKLLPPPSPEANHRYWLDATRDVQVPASALFGLIAVRDLYDRAQALRAGRLWQRLHLLAVSRGLAMQPINQPVELVDRERALGQERVPDGLSHAGGRAEPAASAGRGSGALVAAAGAIRRRILVEERGQHFQQVVLGEQADETIALSHRERGEPARPHQANGVDQRRAPSNRGDRRADDAVDPDAVEAPVDLADGERRRRGGMRAIEIRRREQADERAPPDHRHRAEPVAGQEVARVPEALARAHRDRLPPHPLSDSHRALRCEGRPAPGTEPAARADHPASRRARPGRRGAPPSRSR